MQVRKVRLPECFGQTLNSRRFTISGLAVAVQLGNIENVDRNVAQRVIDYISGAAYSIDGNVKPIDQNRKTFVVAPRNVSLMDRDALAKQAEAQNQQQAYRQVL